MGMDKELERLANKISDLYEELGTWEGVGSHYGLPKIILWRIVNDGYEPKNNKTRRRLGLSAIVEKKQMRDTSGRYA